MSRPDQHEINTAIADILVNLGKSIKQTSLKDAMPNLETAQETLDKLIKVLKKTIKESEENFRRDMRS